MPLNKDETAERLSRVFRRIQETRMHGLPILNPNLFVQVVDGRFHAGDWVGILITPWCMNLVLIPGPDSAHRPGPLGTKPSIGFPAGDFEFLASEEAELGPFCACSLFSPMGDFPDQASAVATAETIMRTLFVADADQSPRTGECSGDRLAPGISRRQLLSGRFRRDRP
ncbi:[NiFe]-hydrogenase assembly chaperone HybE [Thiocystis violacea]|uniref:[NiFe]-hydrogenase assembly chaperone HybE n=1 Tax=Thiocystis violacea TaxID=13725 RepID=UPI001908B80B|nr:[NiFe]-hydrogenase assembly chaperone HybE [Thiocystis violacea]